MRCANACLNHPGWLDVTPSCTLDAGLVRRSPSRRDIDEALVERAGACRPPETCKV